MEMPSKKFNFLQISINPKIKEAINLFQKKGFNNEVNKCCSHVPPLYNVDKLKTK